MKDQREELLAAYAEYVELLEGALAGLDDLAFAHGYQTPRSAGKAWELRQRIAELRAPADLDAPPPQSKLFRRAIEEGEFEE